MIESPFFYGWLCLSHTFTRIPGGPNEVTQTTEGKRASEASFGLEFLQSSGIHWVNDSHLNGGEMYQLRGVSNPRSPQVVTFPYLGFGNFPATVLQHLVNPTFTIKHHERPQSNHMKNHINH